MATDLISGQSGPKDGERAASRIINDAPPKRKPGRPKGSKSKVIPTHLAAVKRPVGRPPGPHDDIKELERVQRIQKRVIARQQKDCARLSDAIATAMDAGQAIEAKDINALARATDVLHKLERAAHDFGHDGAQVKAVIVIPAGPATMEAWGLLAGNTLQGRAVDPPAPVKVQVIEEDIVGDAPPPPPGEDEE